MLKNGAPFDRMRDLFAPLTANPQFDEINASIGEPQIPPPAWLENYMKVPLSQWSQYPRVRPSEEFDNTIKGWLARRYSLPSSWLNNNISVLPAVGSKELLFSFLGMIIREKINDMQHLPRHHKPLVIIPNPYYHTYEAAVRFHGGNVWALDIDDDITNLDFLGEQQQYLCAILICSPDNPSGRFWSADKIKSLINHAQKLKIPLITDECYSEIWYDVPPKGILEISADAGLSSDYIFSINSLSKRSSSAGLRAGFIAGDPNILEKLARFRAFGAPVMPFAIQKMACALWNDEQHVLDMRAHYHANITSAYEYLKDYPQLSLPEGGFFLWLPVKDDIATACRLWQNQAIKTLPGSFLAVKSPISDINLGENHLRIALVHNIDKIKILCERMARELL